MTGIGLLELFLAVSALTAVAVLPLAIHVLWLFCWATDDQRVSLKHKNDQFVKRLRGHE